LIEDSCAQIIRHGHLNIKERKFIGKFKDVSKLNPSLITSEGTYTDDGLKNGLFIAHYLNGNLRSKGAYKNDKYDGHWETYYDNGKPELVFEANDDTIRIINSWNAAGKKIIDNGKGTYQVNIAPITWKGKLENGKPDGTWHAFKTDDVTETSLADEYFKKGVFQKGNSPVKSYTDASRIILINPETLPFTRTEKLRISLVPCNGVKRKHIVLAQYDNGKSSFSEFINLAVGPYISRSNIKDFTDKLVIEGEISEDGRIVNLQSKSIAFHEEFTRGLINQFHNVPALQPATADGKPVKEKFSITFTFNAGVYFYSYSFFPIDQNSLK